MSSKRFGDWTESLLKGADSLMPKDEFTFTTGNNFGLDGFQFDTPDKQGPEDGGRLPTTRGLSGLPDGLVQPKTADLSYHDLTDDSESGVGIDVTAMLSEEEGGLAEGAPIVDLEWLDPTQGQDPDRMPDNLKTLNAIPQLEEAWGSHRQTNGLIPNQDRDGVVHGTPKKSAEEVREAMLRAVRRAHFGDSINTIQAELIDTLGSEASRVASSMRALREEHGLIGKVFIRASAFPGIKNGKWISKIKQSAKTAHYVITEDPVIADKLGMEMVAEVPWEAALKYYSPRLAAAGYRIASSGDPKEILRKAFRVGPEKQAVSEGFKPVERPPVEASAEEAAAALKSPLVTLPTPRSAEEHAIEGKRKAALVQVAKWVKAGKLTQADAFKLHMASEDPAAMLRTASALVAAVGDEHIYEGQGTKLTLEAQNARKVAWQSLEESQGEVENSIKRKFGQYLAHVVKAGLLTEKEKDRIAAIDRPIPELERLIAAAVQMAKTKRVASLEVLPIREYMGVAYTAHYGESRAKFSEASKKAVQDRIAKIAETNSLSNLPDNRVHIPEAAPVKKYADTAYTANVAAKRSIESSISEKEIQGVYKWARQQMSEGVIGNDFDALYKARFALPVRKAAKKTLLEMRAAHEGLAGHLYVDAEAYASPAGVTGCEQGALKHRANGIKHVLAMARCAGCASANVEGVCTKYNKKLVAADNLPVRDVQAYQKRVIHLANAPEAEVTGSMFNPNDFGLRSESFENVSIPVEASVEELGDVLFGGMEV